MRLAPPTLRLVGSKLIQPAPETNTSAQAWVEPASALPSEQGVAWDEVAEKWAQSRAAAEEVSAQVRATPDRTFWHPFFGELDALDWQRMLASHVMSHRLLLERSAGQGRQA